MGNLKLLRRVKIHTIALVMLVTSVTAFFPAAPANADRAAGYGYFSNYYFGTSTRAVIWYDDGRYDGNSMPQFANKEQFISHIMWLYNGDGTTWQERNRIGAYYIIQKMRGATDYGYPDAADVADWMARVRLPNVVLSNENAIDTRTSAYQEAGSIRDDFRYTKTSGIHTDLTASFYQNGSLVFRIRYNCGNPLDNLAGIAPLNYNLNPSITGTPSTAESGSSVNLTPSVNNTGTTASNTTDQWRVTRFQLAPGVGIPGGGTNSSEPNPHYGNGATQIAGGTRSFPRGITNLAVAAQTLGDVPVGTRICFGLSVQPITQADARWRHSNPFCVTIAKKPKVQVEGSDLYVGKGTTPGTAGASRIVTSTTLKNVSGQNRLFGSWGEYAIAATGNITGMGSGAGYSGGNTTTTNICAVSYLTLTNAGTGSCSGTTVKGQYALSGALPDLSARFLPAQNQGANATIVVNTTPERIVTGTGTLRLRSAPSNGTVDQDDWLVVNAPNANVVIEDNIRYANGPYTNISQIPQVIIIANNIFIEGDVTQVDAWLIASGASGRIVTCNDVNNFTQLNATRCGNPLVVNGPVAARHLNLYRTAGSGVGADSGQPAEVFNLRPDAYLWATHYNSSAGRIPTVSSKELPPRF